MIEYFIRSTSLDSFNLLLWLSESLLFHLTNSNYKNETTQEKVEHYFEHSTYYYFASFYN
ncbi:hypothetical protein TXIAM_60016 [Tenacibaculum xiamenense]